MQQPPQQQLKEHKVVLNKGGSVLWFQAVWVHGQLAAAYLVRARVFQKRALSVSWAERLASVMTNLIINAFTPLPKLRAVHFPATTVFSTAATKASPKGDVMSLCGRCRIKASKYMLA